MRKAIILLCALGTVLPTLWAQPAASGAASEASASDIPSFSMVLLRAGVFLASDSAYKDVYGTGPVFGLELRLGKKALVGWLEATFRSASGKSTFTKEDTKATVIGAEGGALYRFLTGKLSAYAGAGLGYYMLKETNSFIGEASGGGIGFCAVGGATYAVTPSIVVDARIKFSSGKMKPADFDINVGGLTLGLGVGIRI
jgi:opacity protein-like surface antigen